MVRHMAVDLTAAHRLATRQAARLPSIAKTARKAVDLATFDFGKHLRGLIGDPKKGMIYLHAHHILFKKGVGPAQQALVDEGQAILSSSFALFEG